MQRRMVSPSKQRVGLLWDLERTSVTNYFLMGVVRVTRPLYILIIIIIIIIIHTFVYRHKVVTLEAVAEQVRSC